MAYAKFNSDHLAIIYRSGKWKDNFHHIELRVEGHFWHGPPKGSIGSHYCTVWPMQTHLVCKTLSRQEPRLAACRVLLTDLPWTKWPPFRRRIFRCIFVNEKFYILVNISLKFVPKCAIDNNNASVCKMSCLEIYVSKFPIILISDKCLSNNAVVCQISKQAFFYENISRIAFILYCN